ncbi:MAG: hypothetical protein AAF378_19405 [Cyanobacteria bacterium P01_A01_bin.84]
MPEILQSRPDLNSGDGTVPQVSAIPIELSNSLNNGFIAETHGALPSHAQVLEDLFNRFKINQFDNLEGVRAPQSAISLSLNDLYLADEVVRMRARVISQSPISGKLKAIITPVSEETSTFNFDFTEQEKEWVLNIDDLKPGLYRVRVETEHSGQQFPTPVHDLFEISG